MAVPVGSGSRGARIRSALTPAEWRRAGALAAAIAALHLIGFGILLLLVVPRDLRARLGRLRPRRRRDRLHARHAPRLRRRPHRRDRQHDPQADERRASARSASASGSRSATRRSCSRSACWSCSASAASPARSPTTTRRLQQRDRPDRPGRLRQLPRADRAAEPGRAGRPAGGLPADARRRLRRGRAGAAAGAARRDEPGLRPRDAGDPQTVADVPARPAVRPRLRHRDRDRPARAGRLARPPPACPSTRSSACRSCSPPGCRCSTRSTARS